MKLEGVPSFPDPRGFIALEGVNGAGKSTLQRKIIDYLTAKGRRSAGTREPGATPLGKAIRSLVVEGKAEEISPLAELLLFAADRAEHVARVIRPALDKGEIVVCDRYYYSMLAFQGFGRGLDLKVISLLNALAIGRVEPDLVILLDLPPEEGLRRNKQGKDQTGEERDVMEQENLAFHRRIRDGFLHIAEESAAPFLVLDALRSPGEVFNEVAPYLDTLLSALDRR